MVRLKEMVVPLASLHYACSQPNRVVSQDHPDHAVSVSPLEMVLIG